MGIRLREEALLIELSPATASVAGTDNLDQAIAQIFNNQSTADSLPVAQERNANFTISSQSLYPVDCRGGSISITPPANPSFNFQFAISDSRANSETNNIIIDFAGANQLVHGSLNTSVLNYNSAYSQFRFIGGAIGWIKQH